MITCHDFSSMQTPEPDSGLPLDMPCMLCSSQPIPPPGSSTAQMHKKEKKPVAKQDRGKYVRRQNRTLTREIFYALRSSQSLHAANLQLAMWLVFGQ